MSLASKITFCVTTAATVGIIYQVHYGQVEDREKLAQGITRDIERIAKKTENFNRLQQQQELTKAFKRIEDRSESDNTSSE